MSKLLFIAFPISKKWSTVFHAYRRACVGDELFKWATDENLHMTLVFLGAVDEELIPEIGDALSEIAAIQQPLLLEFKGVEYGPEGKTPSMVWARFKDNIHYGVLAGRVTEELSYILGRIEALTPMPHVTLARFDKNMQKPKQLTELKDVGHRGEIMEVNQMCLIESKMTQSGSTYNTLATFNFISVGNTQAE